jgi:hypothetical protein
LCIQRWQSTTFIVDVMREVQANSPYAVEKELWRRGVLAYADNAEFVERRPKLADRMLELGQPAVSKHLGAHPATPSHEVMAGMFEMAPNATKRIEMPLWRLLDPEPLTFLGWERCRQRLEMEPTTDEVLTMHVPSLDGRAISQISLPVSQAPTLLTMAGVMLQLRRSETYGDIVGYGVAISEALRVAADPAASQDLGRLQPDLATYIETWFGSVVPAAQGRVALINTWRDIAVAAWNARRRMRESGAALANIKAELDGAKASSNPDVYRLLQTVAADLALLSEPG